MKYFLFTIALFISVSLSAQLKKGEWSLSTGTNVPLNFHLRTNGPGFKSYNFTINPMAGYFITDRLEAGGGPVLNFSGAKYKDNSGNITFNTHSRSYGVNLFTRYYLKKEGKFIPYLTVNAAYLHTIGNSTDFSGIKSDFKIKEWQTGAGAGVNWFISNRTALFSELTYTGQWGGGTGYTSGLNLNVGFRFFLGKKK